MPDRGLIKIVFTLIVFVMMLDCIGQRTANLKHDFSGDLQLNYNLGFSQFYGDASNNGYFKKISGETTFATGLTIRKYINPIFGIGINFLFSGLKSHKNIRATGDTANFFLTGNYFDGNVNLLVDFNSLFWEPGSRKMSVYGIVGFGYSTWNSKLVDSLTGLIKISGDTIGTTTYKKGGFVVPIGLGLNYMFSKNWAFNIEMNLRTVLNDDVDVWRDGFKYDQIVYTSIGISYFINHKTTGNRNRPEKKAYTTEPIKPVPIYDYNARNISNNKSGDNGKVILIDAPVEKKADTPTGIVYRVQVLAKINKLDSFSYLRDRFNIKGDIYENYQDGIYRYSTGSFSSYTEALRYSYLMQDKGITEAFVVAYKNNKRITISNTMKGT